MNVTFKARRGKTKLTIYAVVRINGQEKRIGTGLSSTGRNFRRGKFTGEQAGRLNNQLQIIATELYQIFDTLRAQYTEVSPQQIYDIWVGRKQLSYTFLEVYKLFAEKQRRRFEAKQVSQAVWQKTKLVGEVWADFLKAERLSSLKCEAIKPNIVERWELYMHACGSYKQSYLNKLLSYVRQALLWAVQHEYATANPLQYHRNKPAEKRSIVYLTREELARLEARYFDIPRLQACRDAFLFQCYTSLSFAEMQQLNKEGAQKYISLDTKGLHWLRIERKKVAGAWQLIPLSQKALDLLQAYEYRLPIVSNQKYNAYLREIGNLAGIPETKMQSHTGRRTCGMYLLNELGMSIEAVSKILGHSDIKTTHKHYATLLEHRIATELEAKGFDFAK
jgi:integrase